VPLHNTSLTDYGNKVGIGTWTTATVDSAESAGMTSILRLAKNIPVSGQAVQPSCNEGSRSGATRSDLAGRYNNVCVLIHGRSMVWPAVIRVTHRFVPHVIYQMISSALVVKPLLPQPPCRLLLLL